MVCALKTNLVCAEPIQKQGAPCDLARLRQSPAATFRKLPHSCVCALNSARQIHISPELTRSSSSLGAQTPSRDNKTPRAKHPAQILVCASEKACGLSLELFGGAIYFGTENFHYLPSHLRFVHSVFLSVYIRNFANQVG